jgi:hypothetical protein
MSKNEHDVDEFEEEESAADDFVVVLQSMIEDGVFNAYGFIRESYSYEVTSATEVHKKIIGMWDSETNIPFIFPDLLIKRFKKELKWGDWPVVFRRKKELRKMLIIEGLIVRAKDGSVKHKVSYHGMLVKAWKLDWDAFKKRCKGDNFS